MKKILFRKIAAGTAVIFSLLTTADGFQVLFGMNKPDYIVMMPLLIYNVIMGVFGVIVGVMLWFNRVRAFKLAVIVTSMHLIVLALVSMMHVLGGVVALHSVHAMGLRTLVWLVTVWFTRISNTPSAIVK
ncbi:MAG: hypothetical protein HZB59_09790 [Ignavibacteriales bacterium]|nr:hypothetical protein [Ignavibacteriales bacterium]